MNVELSTTKVHTACKLFVGKLPEGTKSAEVSSFVGCVISVLIKIGHNYT